MTSGDLDQWLAHNRPRADRAKEYGIHSTMTVPIKARGTTRGVAALLRFRRPDPFTDDELPRAGESTGRAAVSHAHARRVSRERQNALALRRTPLPTTRPRTAAVDIAPRCLAAYGYGGNGITFSYMASRIIAALIAGETRPWFDEFALDRA